MHNIIKKTLLFAAFIPALAQGYDKIGLRFNRTGTDANTVSVTIVDQNGKTIEGARAIVTASPAFRASNGAITTSMLCFNANATSNPNITFGINITGLNESITFSEVGVDIHALNGASNYQQNNDNVKRQWNVALSSNASSFTPLTNIDIAAGIGTSGNVHQFWSITTTSPVTVSDGTLALNFTITKGTNNNGCFFGLTDITIGGNSRIETTTEPVNPEVTLGGADKFYHIVWYGDSNSYLTEKSGNSLGVESKSNIRKQYWQFIPVNGKPNVYHVQNALTKNYIEQCKTTQNNVDFIGTQTQPAEYYLSREGTLGGAYRMTSTNCPNYDNTSASPVGLNKHGSQNAIITWAAATTNTGSYWHINETAFDYDAEAAEAIMHHSDYAKTAQVYFMPCGTVNASIVASSLKLHGEGAAKTLDYPCATWSGSTQKAGTPNTSTHWTLYTIDKGAVIPGTSLQVDVKLRGTPPTGYLAQLCFDWDRDGVFEDTYALAPTSNSLNFEAHVPTTAKPGETRMRFRLTDDDDENPEADVVGGQVLDCMIDILDITTTGVPVVSVEANDAQRGAATVNYTTIDDTQQATVTATPLNGSQFCCWLEGRKVVSRQANYSFDVTRPMKLTAVFGAVTDITEQATAGPTIGDVNCDGRISIADLTSLVCHMMGRTNAAINLQAADIDGNLWLDLTDIRLLCNLIAH